MEIFSAASVELMAMGEIAADLHPDLASISPGAQLKTKGIRTELHDERGPSLV